MISEIPFPAGISFLGRQGLSTFSLLLMLSFFTASFLVPRELRRRGLDPQVADWTVLLAILGAILGSKVFFIFEVWRKIWIVDISFWHTFTRVFFTWDGMRYAGGEGMWAQLFSGSGLVFYGGFLFAFLFVYSYLRIKKLPIWKYADSLSPALALGYAIGRLGCFVSGDGCFGHASHSHIPLFTWIYGPSDGNCSADPALAWRYPYMCSSGVRVWNTPVIESLFSCLLFAFLMLWGRHQRFQPGMIFAIFMLWNACVRFIVEFLRLNDAAIPILSPPSYEEEGSQALLPHHIEDKSGMHPSANYFLYWHWHGFTQAQIFAVFIFTSASLWIWKARLYKRSYSG